MSNNDHNGRKWAIGAIITGIVGYIAGILTAPKAGKETRTDIKNTANKALKEAETQLKKAHSEITDLLIEAKKNALKLNEKGKEELASLSDMANKTKEKVRASLSSIHEGIAEDPDLSSVIKEAKEATGHLHQFIKKHL